MRRQAGFSLIELLLVVAIILVIAAIAIPNMKRARMAANEASAVGSVRAINAAETTYSVTYPNLGFTCTLSDMGPPSGGAFANADPQHAGLLDSALSAGVKAGYVFSLSNCTTPAPGFTYRIDAVPAAVGQSGNRAFCSNQGGLISFEPNGNSANCTVGTNPL